MPIFFYCHEHIAGIFYRKNKVQWLPVSDSISAGGLPLLRVAQNGGNFCNTSLHKEGFHSCTGSKNKITQLLILGITLYE